MTNAERQEMSERIAYQFVISDMINQVALRSAIRLSRADTTIGRRCDAPAG